MDTLENLHKKLDGAKDIKSVVRAMKAMAASNIAQYETAVSSLEDYYHTIALGIATYFIQEKVKRNKIVLLVMKKYITQVPLNIGSHIL